MNNNIPYPPLALLKKSTNPGLEFESRRRQLVSYGAESAADITEAEYVDFMSSCEFMNPKYTGKHKDINRLFWLNMSTLVESLGMQNVSEFVKNETDPCTEWKDAYLAPVLLERWSKNKQVFKPDPDFADALFHTKDLQISRWQVAHLPVKEFYIDLSDCKGCAPIVGMFVFVVLTDKELYINEYLLTKDLVYFSFYTGGVFNENGLLSIGDAIEKMTRRSYTVLNPAMQANLPDYDDPVVYKKEKDRTDISLFGVQMIAYLSLQKPDVVEDHITKATYRPQAAVKNKFSEIRRWEVGVRFGQTIRSTIKEAPKGSDCPDEDNGKEETEPEEIAKKARKSPVPHFRCAHWQHYWVGPGRKICEVRWIEPVFVGFGDGTHEVDAVIHKITK